MATKNEMSAAQSAKSKAGRENNLLDAMKYTQISNNVTIFYITAEPTYYIEYEGDPDLEQPVDDAHLDHLIAIANYQGKQILLINTDGTTTSRGQRSGEKTAEGSVLSSMHDQIKNRFLEEHPQFAEYTFIHCMALTFPTNVTTSVRKQKEERKIAEFCAYVNFKIRRRNVTTAERFGIDIAMPTDELCDAIVELANNPAKYDWCPNVLAEVWATQHRDAKHNVKIMLQTSAAIKYRDLLIGSLDVYRQKYTVDNINSFIKEHNISVKLSANKATKVEAVQSFIKNSFPAQTMYPKIPKIKNNTIVYV